MIYPSALRWLAEERIPTKGDYFLRHGKEVIHGTAFPGKASTHEQRSAEIRNAGTRRALARDPRRGIESNLQRVGTRPHGACWGSGRDIFHVRRAKADLPSLDARIDAYHILTRRNMLRTLIEPVAQFVGLVRHVCQLPVTYSHQGG